MRIHYFVINKEIAYIFDYYAIMIDKGAAQVFD